MLGATVELQIGYEVFSFHTVIEKCHAPISGQLFNFTFQFSCMKNIILISLLILSSCGGTLTDEQRRKARESMEQGQLRRVTDAEMTDASFAMGRALTELIEKKDPLLMNRIFLDSLEKVYAVKILSMLPGDSTSRAVESQIIEAYIAGAGQVELNDNIQKLGKDSILYTKPLLRDRPDGSVEFSKALGIRMAKKEIVLSIKD